MKIIDKATAAIVNYVKQAIDPKIDRPALRTMVRAKDYVAAADGHRAFFVKAQPLFGDVEGRQFYVPPTAKAKVGDEIIECNEYMEEVKLKGKPTEFVPTRTDSRYPDLEQLVQLVSEKQLVRSFLVNPEYLRDALTGLTGVVKISIRNDITAPLEIQGHFASVDPVYCLVMQMASATDEPEWKPGQ